MKNLILILLLFTACQKSSVVTPSIGTAPEQQTSEAKAIPKKKVVLPASGISYEYFYYPAQIDFQWQQVWFRYTVFNDITIQLSNKTKTLNVLAHYQLGYTLNEAIFQYNTTLCDYCYTADRVYSASHRCNECFLSGDTVYAKVINNNGLISADSLRIILK